VAHEGADSSAVHPGGRRTGLVLAIVAVAVAVGVGAFFLVRSMTGGPPRPDGGDGPVVATADVGTTGEPVDGPEPPEPPDPKRPGTDEPAASPDAGSTKVEVPLHDAPLTLAVVTIPADATLYVNGEKVDTRKLEGIERGATLRLRAEKTNFTTVERVITASPDQREITLELEALGAPTIEVVVAAPAPAELTVDGRNLGQSPQKVKGQVGQLIRVDATADGYLPFSETFTLEAGKPINLPLRKAAHLIVTVTPPEAALTLNGSRLAPSGDKPGTYDLRTLAVGETVELAADAPNHRAESKKLTLGAEDRIELVLRPKATTPPPEQKGTVWLNARPWAEVFYRGQSKGRTPYEVQLPTGRHTFVLKKGDVEKSVTVTVKANAKATKVVDMQQN
jgi:hypothetical protein